MLKGQCHEIFSFRFFSWIIFPQAPENKIRVMSNFLRKSAEICICKTRCTTGIKTPVANSPQVSMTPAVNFPLVLLVSTIPTANISLMSTAPVASCHLHQRHFSAWPTHRLLDRYFKTTWLAFPPPLSFASWEEASEQRRQKTCNLLVEYSVNDVLHAKHLLCVYTYRVTDINGFLLFGPTTPFGIFLY